MFAEIPSDLLELVKRVVKENIEEYDIELVNNEKGQGFVCEVIFLTLIHRKTREKQQFIVKQEQIGYKEAQEDFDIVVRNEMTFYETIWPFLQNYFKHKSQKDLNHIPKCFGTLYTDRKRIILENLRPQGYVLYDKTKQFDDDHFRTIFKTYGIHHALSMALREQDSKEYNRLTEMVTSCLKRIYNPDDHPYCKKICEAFREVQEYFDPIQENHLLEKLRMYEESGIKLIRQCVNEDFPKGVMLHGDCWSNNMMFKYDEQGKPQDIKLLDFQLICHGTPVFDLSYCLYTGASEETLTNLDDYLRIYHSSLSDTLKEFALSAENIYSFKTLKEEWKRFCKYGFPIGLFIMKMKLVEEDDIPDFSEGFDAPVRLTDQMKERYKKQVRALVIHFYNHDFF